MTDITFTLARPEKAEDCLPESVDVVPQRSLWIGYLALDRTYLEDLNDDPRRDVEFDVGTDIWIEKVPTLISSFVRRFGGALVQASNLWYPKRPHARSNDRAASEWTAEVPGRVDPSVVAGLTTYGNIAMLWTSMPAAPGATRISPLHFDELRWWMIHGYKEAFVVGYTPELDTDALINLIQRATGLAVELTTTPFVPHRIRAHRGDL